MTNSSFKLLAELTELSGSASIVSEMAKRSTTDQFYKFAKDMYGAEKVKALKWPEVVAVGKKHDVLIPPYLRTQKVGRGLFNLVPADHADTKAPVAKKEEPKAAPAKSTAASDADLDRALSAVKSEMRSAFRNSYADWRNIESGGQWRDGRSFDVRDWGEWEGDDGSGDYDWQRPTSATKKTLAAIVAGVQKKFPSIELDHSFEEKNWIVVNARAKK